MGKSLQVGIALLLVSSTCGQIVDPAFPLRVHVFEDFETEIEKRWWLRGTPVTNKELLPPSRSSLPNTRAMRSAPSKDFDRKMGDQSKMYRAVIFNPVPGPPMAGNTRLDFRYFLTGTDTLRVQIYSLSKGYHRQTFLKDLPQGKWQSATVDMTQLRRPDGSGGPLSKDERIDDIQFYVEPDQDVLIDDIVLYDPIKSSLLPVPKRVIFTGWFDTGKQGAGHEWPGDFDIVLHEKPKTWDAAKSVINTKTQKNWIRVLMRGMRPLAPTTRLKFLYKLPRFESYTVTLANSQTGQTWASCPITAIGEGWQEHLLDFKMGNDQHFADEIRFEPITASTSLWVDDLLLYEPGDYVLGK